jgi:tRNA threonylcarbamoyl adenosine modification protein YeaZ
MYTLAIELAAAEGSLALARGDELVAETSWQAGRRASQQIFGAIEALADEHLPEGVASLSCLVVGRGPGSYSGLRVAMAVANGLALPGQVECYTLPSWSGPVHQLAQEHQLQHITVVGDARRERFWYGSFACGEGVPRLREAFDLVPAPELAKVLGETNLAVATDTVSAEALQTADCPHQLIDHPQASALLAAAQAARAAGIPSGPMTPIYIHPPVFVKPRFA